MRLGFQRNPWDLYACAIYAVITSIFLVTGTSSIFAIPLVLFVPGYVLIAVFFPTNKELNPIERVALSFVLSVIVIALIGLLFDLTKWTIALGSIAIATAISVLLLDGPAYWRRMQLRPEERLSSSLEIHLPDWDKYSRTEKALTILLVASTVSAVSATVYVITSSQSGERFTEFYTLASNNSIAFENLLHLNVSERTTIVLVVANHEGSAISYAMRIDVVGVRTSFNATTGFNDTLEVNRTTWTWQNASVGDGANWSFPYTFAFATVGFWKVQFLLFKGGDFINVYRQLRLYARVGT